MPSIRRNKFSPAIAELTPVAEFELDARVPANADAVAIFLFSDSKADLLDFTGLPKDIGHTVAGVLAHGDFKAKAGAWQAVPGAGNLPRIILLGLGKSADFLKDQEDLMRWAGARAVQAAQNLKLRNLLVHPGALLNDTGARNWAELAPAFAEGVVLGGFSFKLYKSGKTQEDNSEGAAKKASVSTAKTVRIILSRISPTSANEIAVASQVQIAAATNYARHIACQPANVVNPATLVSEARRMARQTGLKCTVLDAKAAARLGMGGLLAVGQGSQTPPAMIFLEYNPAVGRRGQSPVVIVGKAVTFDTGGISIKPAADMGAMKYDKCGGMAVMGIMRAVACIGLNQRVIGVIPTAENSVDAAAYRPGDIIRMYNGKTVDVTNTDAEGRMILADALAYACEKYKPRAIADMATLTGGVVTALGGVFAGLMTNQDQIAAQMVIAGQKTGEWLWRLPLHPRYAKLLESPHADFTNSGGREAHPIQGGMFLNEFVPENIPWAHLDIAGTANPRKEQRYISGDNASGFGVRLIVEYLRSLPE